MKRGLLLSAVLGVTLLLTGCGNKSAKLVCTMKQTQMGLEMETTATTHFDSKGKATKIDMDMVVDAKSETAAKAALSAMKSSYDDVKQDGTKVLIKETIKPEASDKDATIKEVKKQFTSQGFKCK